MITAYTISLLLFNSNNIPFLFYFHAIQYKKIANPSFVSAQISFPTTNLSSVVPSFKNHNSKDLPTFLSETKTIYKTKNPTNKQHRTINRDVKEIVHTTLYSQAPRSIQSAKNDYDVENNLTRSLLTDLEREQEQTSSTTNLNSSSSSLTDLKQENISSKKNQNSSLVDLEQDQEQEQSSTSKDQTYAKGYAITPRVSGTLGFFGGLLILVSVLRNEEKRGNVYHRLLAGMSVIDVNQAFWYTFSTYCFRDGYVSNQMLCSAQGWGIQSGIASPIYNTSLACYYLLVIKYQWLNYRLKEMEVFFHGVPLAFGTVTSLAGLGLKLYNNANLWCWIASYPSDCTDNCIRGKNAYAYRYAFFYGPLFCTVFVSIILTGLTIHYVISVESRAKKYKMNKTERAAQRPYSKRVAMQSFFYIGAYFITWTPIATIRFLQLTNKQSPKWLLLWASFMNPFQGAMNALVYFRRRIIRRVRNSISYIGTAAFPAEVKT